MPAQLSYSDMEVSLTAPTGYTEPVGLTRGANWRPGDVRMMFVAGGASSSGVIEDVAMTPDPPTGYTASYSAAPGFATEGVYYRYLQSGDSDTSVSWPKPPGWRYYFRSFITARGVDPANPPTAGRLTWSHTVGDAFFTVSSVTVPAAGQMLFFLGTTTDLDDSWPNWSAAMGVPTGWTPLVATDKSGIDFYQYATDPSLMVVGKSYASAGSTGTVTVPCAHGAPAFLGLYAFLRAAPDVSGSIGAI